MNYKKQISLLCIINFLGYMAFSLGTTQFVPYLIKIGYSPMERGILLSSIAITTILFQLVFGYLSDKHKTVKKIFILVFVFFAISTYFFYVAETKSFVLHILLIALCGGNFNLELGVIDNWVLEINETTRQKYSVIRAFGSLGWAIGSSLVAFVINLFGYKGVSNTILVIAIVAIGVSLLLEDASKYYDDEVEPISKQEIHGLLTNKKYLLLIGIIFLLMSMNTFNTYAVVDKLVSLGASSAEVGLSWSIRGIVEIPMFFAGAYFLRKLNAYRLLSISAMMYTLQFILFGFAGSVTSMLILCVMQMVTYPLTLLGAKVLIDDLVSESCKSTGQLLAMSIYSGASALIIPFLIGALVETFSINTTLFAASSFSILAFGLVFVLKKMKA